MGLRRRIEARELIVNPSLEELRRLASKEEKTTIYGSASYITKVRNRSAKNTYVVEDGLKLGVFQQPISLEKAAEIAEKVLRYLKDKVVIQVDRTMGQTPEARMSCRLYITSEYARIPYMWCNTLFPPEEGADGREHDMISVYVPEWPERVIFVHPEEAITYILGTDYFGECKKSFLRMAMYLVKKRKAWLGFHAGSKVLRVKGNDGGTRDVGFIMFGLSGTGKTTLTVHNHNLSNEEGVIIRQDDAVFMDERGYCYGSENGFFFKTEGLDESQRVLFDAATKPTAVLENVKVYDDGTVDFGNFELTTNGRGVVLRSEVMDTDEEIDLERADKILFITRRNDIVPVVAKLNPAQGAAFFMLGESIETSAGDPTKAGQAKREVGTNPFIMGPEYEEGNRLFEILKANPDIECFLLNTGYVGGKPGSQGEKITIQVSAEIMKQIAKNGIEWREDPDWGYLVPSRVESINMEKYNPKNYFSEEEYRALTEKLRNERKAWLEQFPELDPAIPASIRCAE